MAPDSPIAALRARYLAQEADPLTVLEGALAHANSNAGHNVYLAQDPAWSRNEARRLDRAAMDAQPLWGVPVSLKDCFDLAGFATTCGTAFYGDLHGVAAVDSAVAARLRAAGAVLTGKTHLHPLAYGITGENPDFGDCTQPADALLLTGGSSSGAAASVQEGSAMAAIGTDTGGSIRVPAALCGLAGYRSSISRNTPGVWRGGAHLAPSFDTLGWLYRDLRDGPLLGHALFDLPLPAVERLAGLRIGLPGESFLYDCEADVRATYVAWQGRLEREGMLLGSFDAAIWDDAFGILAPIQASEAAALHRGNFQHFEASIAERLAWGASLSNAEVDAQRRRLAEFRERTYALFRDFDALLLPCAPMSALLAGTDHSRTRARILRYTAPLSLAGLPVVTLPGFANGRPAGGLQLVGPMGGDAGLLALSAVVGSL